MIFQSGISNQATDERCPRDTTGFREQVEKLIHLARGEEVLLDADLARLYGVEHGVYALHHSHRTALHTSLRLAPPYVEAT